MASPTSSFVDISASKLSTDQITTEDINEIKQRVVKAASDGLSMIAHGKADHLQLQPKHNYPTTIDANQRSLWNFSDQNLFPYHKFHTVPDVPANAQEQIVINELLHCLVGVRGTYIVPVESKIDGFQDVTFTVSTKIDNSIRDIVQEILPLARHYSTLQRFTHAVNRLSAGSTLQALGSAIRSLTYDYYIFLVQLESEHTYSTMTLHKMLYLLRPTMGIFEVLSNTIKTIQRSGMQGAEVLTYLYTSITALSGNTSAQQIVRHLTERAARPYIKMLQLWIKKGIILDPHLEFLVEDNEIINRDVGNIDHYSAEYWEKRYTIRRDKVPTFFNEHSDRILRAGKYLNVIRQCGTTQFLAAHCAPQNDVGALQFCLAYPLAHEMYIRDAYKLSSRTLLRVLVDDNDLMGHLLSMKRYLLLHQGDFINQFMDASEKELSKNVDKVLPMRLENLLGLALRLSSTKYDKYNDDLHCQLFPFKLMQQMDKVHLVEPNEDYWQNDKINLTGLECFAFRYDVKWPISLVLNHIAILEYQMLFRQLFYCKHVERQLCKVWKENNNAKKFAPESAELYRSAFTLRQRMMNAIQNLEYYMMIEVIDPAWHEFVDKIGNVSNVDDVLLVHQHFLDDCLYNCMLKNPDLLRSVTKLCNMCLNFCKFIQKAQHYFVDAELCSMMRSDDSSDSDCESESFLAPSETFSERIKRFDLEFTFILTGLLKKINENANDNPSSKLINLIHRINFNSFYNQHLDQISCKTAA